MGTYAAYDTRAALEAVSSSPPAYAYVGEVDATYRYDSGSTDTPDDWLILDSAAGGNYIATSYELQLPPIGDGSDDWPNFAALCASTAAAGKRMRFGPYTYYCQSRQVIPSNAYIALGPLTQVACDMGLVDNLDAPFTVQGINYGNGDTLAANTNIGDMSFVITGNITPVAGQYVLIYDKQFRAAHYKVVSYNSGTKRVTIDRPLRMAHGSPITTASFPTGTPVIQTTIIENVKIEFNGARIYGSCERFIEIILARKSNFVGPVYCGDGTTTTALDRIMSLDETCFDCHASQIYGYGAGVTTLGTSFEAAEGSSYTRCEMTGMTYSGHIFQDAIDCVLNEQINHNNTGPGVTFTAAAENAPPTGSGSVWGSQASRIVGGSNSKNDTGVLFERGSSYCTVDSVSIVANVTGVGELNVPAAEPAPGYYNQVTGNSMIRLNTGNGVYLSADSNYFVVGSAVINDNANGVQATASAVAPTIAYSRMDSNTAITLLAASNITLLGGGGKPPSSNTNVVIYQPNATWMDAIATNFASANTSANIFQLGGTLFMPSGRATPVSGGIGIYAQSGATAYVGMQATVSGAGSGGSNLYLASGGTAYVAQGATVPNYSVRCATTANSTATLNTILGFSQHNG